MALTQPVFAILPGVGIGPFRLGITEAEANAMFLEHGLRNASAFVSGCRIAFTNGRATQVEFAANMGLSLAGQPLTDPSNDNVRRLLGSMTELGPDWTELQGLAVFHWEATDDAVFSFMVYAPGHRYVRPTSA